jgi:7,8-dihydro-6-hydroxymethylpterin-pyrophosphokinase
LSPIKLLEFTQSIEKKLKRTKTIKNGPRTIDLDILFYENKIIKTKNLTVPHPRLHHRLFVLEPLNELCPDFLHPVLKKSINYLKTKSKNSKSSIVRQYQSTK